MSRQTPPLPLQAWAAKDQSAQSHRANVRQARLCGSIRAPPHRPTAPTSRVDDRSPPIRPIRPQGSISTRAFRARHRRAQHRLGLRRKHIPPLPSTSPPQPCLQSPTRGSCLDPHRPQQPPRSMTLSTKSHHSPPSPPRATILSVATNAVPHGPRGHCGYQVGVQP